MVDVKQGLTPSFIKVCWENRREADVDSANAVAMLFHTGTPLMALAYAPPSRRGISLAVMFDEGQSFGEFLRGLRRSRRFNQEQLAAASGVSVTYIRLLEAGPDPKTGKEQEPSWQILRRLAAGLAEGDPDREEDYFVQLGEAVGMFRPIARTKIAERSPRQPVPMTEEEEWKAQQLLTLQRVARTLPSSALGAVTSFVQQMTGFVKPQDDDEL